MLLESVMFGLLLVLIAGWQKVLFSASIPVCAVDADGTTTFFRSLVGYVGAGIYEELLFRLILLSGAVGILRLLRIPPRAAMVIAVVLVSLAFSVAHYQLDFMILGQHVSTSHGEPFSWYSFLFRFLAGVYFSLLFLFRGFGISCGAHAMYDIFTLI
jgi:membrane protease YdiL (CAAX protease family)